MSDVLRPEEQHRLRLAIEAREKIRGPIHTAPGLCPRPRADQKRAPSLIDVHLAKEQRHVVELDAARSVLILGEAGHGKTTVALHRLAHLYRASKTTLRIALIVPTEGLTRLLQPLVRKLGVDVEVTTYDTWARSQARRAFRDLPRRESEDARPGVARLKRHPALRIALRELCARRPGRIDNDEDRRQTRSKAHVRRGDLQHLFGDSELLSKVLDGSNESARVIADVLDHTRVQFNRTTEAQFAHVVDRERLIAVDHKPIDQGTTLGDAGTVDTEDYAVLFELDRMRAEIQGRRATEPQSFDVILIDEAQELAPLELALIGRSLAADGVAIVAGDDAQQIDPSVTFVDWAESMRELGLTHYDEVTLDVGYRCPPRVVEIARAVIGIPHASDPSRASASDSQANQRARSFPEPICVRFDAEVDRVAWLATELDRLSEKDSSASTVILCRSALTARELARWLRGTVPCRWVTDGRFRSRGIQIATIDQVKGLEFDNVVVADADAHTYPDRPDARRTLYVALTRARFQLVFLSIGIESPLLSDMLATRYSGSQLS